MAEDATGSPRVGLIVLADTETHADMGRVANALEAAKELHETGDLVMLVFDGAGTKWVGELAGEGRPLHRQFVMVRDPIAGACRYCARTFSATDGVQAAGIPLLGEYEGHPSIRKLVAHGYQVITF